MAEADRSARDEMFYSNPVHSFMGFRLVQEEPTAIIVVEDLEAVRGAMPGTIHGGVLATLSDVTSAMALSGAFEFGAEVPVTTDMHVRYFRQPSAAPITAEAVVAHRGRRLLSVECSIVDGADRVLVRSTATYMLVPFNAG